MHKNDGGESMFIHSQKGQAFSVFQLLIAAVVALAILGLLMTIIGGIGFDSQQSASNAASDLLKNARQGEFTPQSRVATFKTNDIINPRALENATDVGSNGVLVCVDSDLDSRFGGEGPTLRYTSASDLRVTVKAYCGTRGEVQEEFKTDNGLTEDLTCKNTEAEEDASCIVAVLRG